jgi:hypothetical protein
MADPGGQEQFVVLDVERGELVIVIACPCLRSWQVL